MAERVWTRDYLKNQYGLSDKDIGWDEKNKKVQIRGKNFDIPTTVENGKSYASPQDIDKALGPSIVNNQPAGNWSGLGTEQVNQLLGGAQDRAPNQSVSGNTLYNPYQQQGSQQQGYQMPDMNEFLQQYQQQMGPLNESYQKSLDTWFKDSERQLNDMLASQGLISSGRRVDELNNLLNQRDSKMSDYNAQMMAEAFGQAMDYGNMQLDYNRLNEDARQFGTSMGEERRQFDTSMGQDAYQFERAMEQEDREFAAQLGLDYDKLNQQEKESLRNYNLSREAMLMEDRRIRDSWAPGEAGGAEGEGVVTEEEIKAIEDIAFNYGVSGEEAEVIMVTEDLIKSGRVDPGEIEKALPYFGISVENLSNPAQQALADLQKKYQRSGSKSGSGVYSPEREGLLGTGGQGSYYDPATGRDNYRDPQGNYTVPAAEKYDTLSEELVKLWKSLEKDLGDIYQIPTDKNG